MLKSSFRVRALQGLKISFRVRYPERVALVEVIARDHDVAEDGGDGNRTDETDEKGPEDLQPEFLSVFFHLFRLKAVPLLGNFVLLAILFNIILAVFNLIPIPPLDGSQALFSVLPSRYARVQNWLERYGFMLLIGLIFFDRITGIPILWGWIGPFVTFFGQLFAGAPAFWTFIQKFWI